MPDNSILIGVSAISGLAGALGSQIINAINTYFIDKRKQSIELNNQFRAKKIEIGESFYFITGEKMAAIKKNIRYWRNWHNSRSVTSLEFLRKEMIKLNDSLEKLNDGNWKYNLIEMYFDIYLTNDTASQLNAKTHKQYLKVLDITDSINNDQSVNNDELYRHYGIAIYDLCSLYEDIYQQMVTDMESVRKSLLCDFKA